MARKPTYEELEHRVKQLGKEVNKRKRAEEALRKSERKYRTLLEHLPQKIFHKDSNSVYISCNQNYARDLKIKPEDIKRKTDLDFYPKKLADKYRADDKRIITSAKTENIEEKYIQDGQEIWVQTAKTPVKDEKGNVTGILGIFWDITQRKQAEEVLHQSEEKYRGIFDESIAAVYVFDEKKHFIDSNQAGLDLLGYSRDELLSMSIPDVDADPVVVLPAHKQLLSGENIVNYEHQLRRKDGMIITVLNNSRPLTDAVGNIIGMQSTLIDITKRKQAEEELKKHRNHLEEMVAERTSDLRKTNEELQREITERKQAEEALRASEEKYRALVETTDTGFVVMDGKYGKVFDANSEYIRLTGHQTLGEILGRSVVEWTAPYDRERNAQEVVKCFERGFVRGLEIDYVHKNGTIVPIEVNATVVETKDGLVIFSLCRDITKRKRAEEAVRESEERYRTLFDSAADIIAVINTEGKILDLNKMFEEESGYSRGEMIGKNVFTSGIITKESGDRALYYLKRLLHGEELPIFKVDGVKKDGGLVPYELRAAPIMKDGTVVGVQAVLRNISERKQAEEQRRNLEAKLLQAQKMEAIGTLSGGIAHDFNNLLMAIQSNAFLVLIDLDSTHPYYDPLENINDLVTSGAELTRQLLGYARKGRYYVRTLNLNQLVEKTSETIRRTRKDIVIVQDLAENLFAIEADQGQIEQVLMNLFVNSGDAMPLGGDLTLKTMNVTHKDMEGKLFEPKPGNYVRLTVTDTGKGMDIETVERIFEPFYTTKEMGRGTGLGLASVYGIIKGHYGYIDVESEPGCGTTFTVYLPSTEKTVEETVKPPEEIVKGTETILMVDDEEQVLDAGVMVLKRLGYTVLEARGGKEAVEIYKDNKDKIDLVILDMIMPRMGGGETYDRMKEINPDVKVLLSSGYSIDSQAKEILARGCDAFIHKPFGVRKLSQKIREVLQKEKAIIV